MGSDIQLRRDELGPEDADGKNVREARAAAISRGNQDMGLLGEEARTPKKLRTASSATASPLDELFSRSGKSQVSLHEGENGDGVIKRNSPGEELVRTHAEEFDELRRQLDSMKDGQARVEAMLQRLVPTGTSH
jgi:hypothetical protein